MTQHSYVFTKPNYMYLQRNSDPKQDWHKIYKVIRFRTRELQGYIVSQFDSLNQGNSRDPLHQL